MWHALGKPIAVAALAALALGLPLPPYTPPASGEPLRARSAEPPNIVVILTDDQRWDTLAWMPTVTEEVVAKGVNFINAFAHDPACCPSRATFLTGNYSHTTGVWSNVPPYGSFSAFTSEDDTIAVWLDDAGYRTAFMGKYLNEYGPASHVPPGWDVWRAFVEPGYFHCPLSVDGRLVEKGTDPRDYSTDAFARQADRFIRETPDGDPLFLFFAPKAPHGPARPAPRHLDDLRGIDPYRSPAFNEADVSDKPAYIQARSQLGEHATSKVDRFRRRQLETLQAVDQAVARILAALDETGRLRNTLIVFTSDNGFAWGSTVGERSWSPTRRPSASRSSSAGTG